MESHQFDEYIKKLVKSAANAFSIVSLIIALIASISPIDLSAKTHIIAILILLCIIYAGYKVWKKDKKPSANDFKIISSTPSFRPHAYLGDGRIDNKSRFTIDFDLRNLTGQSIFVNRPEIMSLELDGDLFSNVPSNINFNKPFNSLVPINFPYTVEKDIRETIRCEINMPLLVSDSISFAEKLINFNEYEIMIKLSYEDMTTATKTQTFKFNGNFDAFKQDIIEFWKEKKLFELICKATGTS